MRFVHDGTKIDLFFCENLIRTISKRYLSMCEEFISKHDLMIQNIGSRPNSDIENKSKNFRGAGNQKGWEPLM